MPWPLEVARKRANRAQAEKECRTVASSIRCILHTKNTASTLISISASINVWISSRSVRFGSPSNRQIQKSTNSTHRRHKTSSNHSNRSDAMHSSQLWFGSPRNHGKVIITDQKRDRTNTVFGLNLFLGDFKMHYCCIPKPTKFLQFAI
jgi:hypothetical protein